MPKNNDRSTTLSHTSNDGRNQINLTTPNGRTKIR